MKKFHEVIKIEIKDPDAVDSIRIVLAGVKRAYELIRENAEGEIFDSKSDGKLINISNVDRFLKQQRKTDAVLSGVPNSLIICIAHDYAEKCRVTGTKKITLARRTLVSLPYDSRYTEENGLGATRKLTVSYIGGIDLGNTYVFGKSKISLSSNGSVFVYLYTPMSRHLAYTAGKKQPTSPDMSYHPMYVVQHDLRKFGARPVYSVATYSQAGAFLKQKTPYQVRVVRQTILEVKNKKEVSKIVTELQARLGDYFYLTPLAKQLLFKPN